MHSYGEFYIPDVKKAVAKFSKRKKVAPLLKELTLEVLAASESNSNVYNGGCSCSKIYVLVYKRSSRICAVANCSLHMIDKNSFIMLSTGLWVHENYRGRGIAQLLMELKKYLAKEWGTTRMIATISQTNNIQRHLLQKYGWRILDRGASDLWVVTL